MREKLKKLWAWLKASRKAKLVGVHAAVVILMALGLYVAPLPVMSAYLKLCGSMLLGAYCLKPVADWACSKLL